MEFIGLPGRATSIVRHFTFQAVTLKMLFLHNNVTAWEMLFPKCLFPDEILLLACVPTMCAWKLRDIYECEISVTIKCVMLPAHLPYILFALSMSSKYDFDSFLTQLLVIHLSFLLVPIILHNVLPEHALSNQQGLCLTVRPCFVYTPKPHGLKVHTFVYT